MKNHTNKAFTLIELLVVISIIGLFASVVIVPLNNLREKAIIGTAMEFDSANYHAYASDASVLYDFDGASIAGDASGNNNTLTMTNAPATVSGIAGNALQFDGTNYAVSTKTMRIDKDWTMSAWVNPAIDTGGTKIFASFSLPYLAFSNVFFISWTADVSGTCVQKILYDTTARQVNKWYHVIGTHNETTGVTDLYVNGKLVNSFPSTYACARVATLNIGSHSGGTYRFTGIVDNVRIYTHALSLAQVEDMYSNEIALYEGEGISDQNSLVKR